MSMCITTTVLFYIATTAMGGDVTVAASAASQQNKTSQSQSSTDSSQVDGTQPIIMDNDMTFSASQVLCDPDKQSALHKSFQTVKSKQLLQDCFSDSVNDVSDSVARGEVNFDPSADCNAMELLEPCKQCTYRYLMCVITQCMCVCVTIGYCSTPCKLY